MAPVLVILLIVAAVITLIALIRSLKKTEAPTIPKSPPKAPVDPTPAIRSTVGPRPSPQITVYTDSASKNAFRCPVCDSKPAPNARFCQVCGQVFQSKGAN